MAKVLSIEEVRTVDTSRLPDGHYPGKWSGYVVKVTIDGIACRLKTDVGVRGIDCPCTVRVRGGVVTVEG